MGSAAVGARTMYVDGERRNFCLRRARSGRQTMIRLVRISSTTWALKYRVYAVLELTQPHLVEFEFSQHPLSLFYLVAVRGFGLADTAANIHEAKNRMVILQCKNDSVRILLSS